MSQERSKFEQGVIFADLDFDFGDGATRRIKRALLAKTSSSLRSSITFFDRSRAVATYHLLFNDLLSDSMVGTQEQRVLLSRQAERGLRAIQNTPLRKNKRRMLDNAVNYQLLESFFVGSPASKDRERILKGKLAGAFQVALEAQKIDKAAQYASFFLLFGGDKFWQREENELMVKEMKSSAKSKLRQEKDFEAAQDVMFFYTLQGIVEFKRPPLITLKPHGLRRPRNNRRLRI